MRRKQIARLALFVIGVAAWGVFSGGHALAQATWSAVTSDIQQVQAMEDEITAIISKMSVEEKVGQMVQPEIASITPAQVAQYFIGSVLNGGGAWPNNDKHAPASAWVSLADSYYNASVDPTGQETTTQIPILWGTDAVHGHSNVYGATLFPHNIGLGAANDPALIKAIGVATAEEIAATGIDWTFAPTLAVVRDDRWGRTYEGYSEDPTIVYNYGGEMVKGLQGDATIPAELFTDSRVVATAKHFLGDGGTDKGTDQGNNLSTEQQLIDIHAQGYRSALAAGAQTVMASFNSWNGMKMHGNQYLLTDVLKGTMKFDGFVVGDWNGHGQLKTTNTNPASAEDCSNTSCPAAINAGVDVIMVPADWQAFWTNTVNQVKAGTISEARVNDAVRRILRVKMRSGLMGYGATAATKGKPSTRALAGNTSVLGSTAHRDVARDAVRKSLVLLKNNNNVLPLDRTARVLVAGKSADSIMNQSGGWTLTWQGTSNTNADFLGAASIWQGISAIAPNATLSADGTAAGTFDVAIAVIGETPYAEGSGDLGNSKTLEHARNYPADLAVLNTLAGKGIPVVTVFLSGRPLYVNKELNRSDAFVAAWLPGSEGAGIADVLFKNDGGAINYDFTGQLSFSWPNAPCQTPLNRNDGNTALFAYGFGLTYADTNTLGTLTEEERNYGCEQTPPSGDTNTILEIFMNGANRTNVGDLGNYVLRIGAPSNWSVDVSTDPAATTATPSNEVTVTTENGSVQASAKRVVWAAAGQVYSQLAEVTPGKNLGAYLNSQTTVKFRVKVNAAPTGNVNLAMHCEYPCVSELPFGDYLRSLPVGQWQEINAHLACFNGLDTNKVNTPFLLHSDGPMDLSIEEVRWEPKTASATPDCSGFGATVDVIDASVHHVFNNGLATGYEFANWQNTSSQIVPNPDGSGDNVWSATLAQGTNIEIKKSGLPANLSAYNTATGRLAFDIRVASLTGTGADILVKVGKGWPNLSDLFLFSEVLDSQPELNTWIPVSIPVQTLLASDNALNPGAYANIQDVVDMLVLESYNAAGDSNAEIYVRNVRWIKDGSVTPPAETLSYDGYNLMWTDEFDGAALDTSKWSYDIGYGPNPYARGWGNSELQWYSDSPENISVSGGSLNITLKKHADGIPTSIAYTAPGVTDPNPSYTSARIHTQDKVAFKYGIVTARMKLPKGNGVWPAFWMLGNKYMGYYETRPAGVEPWPVCGEIDIMEMPGKTPNVITGALHFGGKWPDNHFLGGSDAKDLGTPYTLPSGAFDDGFHTFSVKWEEGSVKWYVDDQLFQVIAAENSVLDWYSHDMDSETKLLAPAPFNKEFFILLNLALAGDGTAFPAGVPDATTVFPQTMEVDYIRVYTAVAPTVTVEQAAAQADPTSGSPVNFTVTFSEAVTGFDNSDVTLGGTAGATTAVVSGSGAVYQVAVSGMTGNGIVTVSVPANAAVNAAGTGNAVSASADNRVTYNASLPLLMVKKTGAGAGTVTSNLTGITCGADCAEGYGAGTTVTLTATPEAGSVFVSWTEGCAGTGSCVVTVNRAATVRADFALAAWNGSETWQPWMPVVKKAVGSTVTMTAFNGTLYQTIKGAADSYVWTRMTTTGDFTAAQPWNSNGTVTIGAKTSKPKTASSVIATQEFGGHLYQAARQYNSNRVLTRQLDGSPNWTADAATGYYKVKGNITMAAVTIGAESRLYQAARAVGSPTIPANAILWRYTAAWPAAWQPEAVKNGWRLDASRKIASDVTMAVFNPGSGDRLYQAAIEVGTRKVITRYTEDGMTWKDWVVVDANPKKAFGNVAMAVFNGRLYQAITQFNALTPSVGKVWTRSCDGTTWSPWELAGTSAKSGLTLKAATVNNQTRLYLVVNSGGKIKMRYHDGKNWSPAWVALGATTNVVAVEAFNPTPSTPGSERLYLAAPQVVSGAKQVKTRYVSSKSAAVSESAATPNIVTIRKSGTGNGTVTVGEWVCAATCQELRVPVISGVTVSVSPTPDANSAFIGWQNANGEPLAGLEYMRAGETVIAVFNQK